MSIIKQIYKAPVDEKTEDFITVSITINGQEFYGWAHCHPDDKEFCSKKVGTTIAHMRATIAALKYQRDTARYEYKVLKKAFFDAHQNIPDDLDVSNPFRTALWQAENRYHKYQKEVNKMRKVLRDYLISHEKAITSLKAQREIAAKAKDN